MKTVVLVIMILVCFNFLLKQTYHKWVSVLVVAAVCALFVGLMWPLAIEQSKTQIADWLANTSLMLDTSVILTIEVIIQLAFCLLAVSVYSSHKIRKPLRWVFNFLYWFPGVLIFVVLFCALVELIFAFPGISFSRIAWVTAVVIFALIPFGKYLLSLLLPELELRLELLFLSNVLLAILGIIATVNGRTAMRGESAVNWGALLGLIGILLVGGFIGMLVKPRKRKILLMSKKEIK